MEPWNLAVLGKCKRIALIGCSAVSSKATCPLSALESTVILSACCLLTEDQSVFALHLVYPSDPKPFLPPNSSCTGGAPRKQTRQQQTLEPVQELRCSGLPLCYATRACLVAELTLNKFHPKGICFLPLTALRNSTKANLGP